MWVLLGLCDLWRVWVVSTFAAIYVSAPVTATNLLPYWLVLVVAVAIYDTANQLRRGCV